MPLVVPLCVLGGLALVFFFWATPPGSAGAASAQLPAVAQAALLVAGAAIAGPDSVLGGASTADACAEADANDVATSASCEKPPPLLGSDTRWSVRASCLSEREALLLHSLNARRSCQRLRKRRPHSPELVHCVAHQQLRVRRVAEAVGLPPNFLAGRRTEPSERNARGWWARRWLGVFVSVGASAVLGALPLLPQALRELRSVRRRATRRRRDKDDLPPRPALKAIESLLRSGVQEASVAKYKSA